MKYLAAGLLVFAFIFFALAFKGKSAKSARPQASATRTALPKAQTADSIADGLANSGKIDKAKQQYDRRIASVHYSHNMAAVAHTCLEKYHRDSCIHHLIKCGPKCKVLIPEQKFAFIESQYWELMRERGLEQEK